MDRLPQEIFFSPLRFVEYENDLLYRDKVKDFLRQQHISASMRALTLAKHMSAYRSYTEKQRLLSSNV